MLLAELEVWHSRPTTPTRRVALGHLVLPVDPSPGFGGLLLGAVVAKHLPDVDDELVPDIHRLLEPGRARRSRHPAPTASPLPGRPSRPGGQRAPPRGRGRQRPVRPACPGQPAGAGAWAPSTRSNGSTRRHGATWCRCCTGRCGGAAPIGPSFVANLAGSASTSLAAMADPRAWALELLGFPLGTAKVSKKEITARYRDGLRRAHPDHGGDEAAASKAIPIWVRPRKILSA